MEYDLKYDSVRHAAAFYPGVLNGGFSLNYRDVYGVECRRYGFILSVLFYMSFFHKWFQRLLKMALF